MAPPKKEKAASPGQRETAVRRTSIRARGSARADDREGESGYRTVSSLNAWGLEAGDVRNEAALGRAVVAQLGNDLA